MKDSFINSKIQSLSLPELFKIMSNQSRLEILVLLKDQCSTATEIATRLDMDISSVYRSLKFLEVNGLITSFVQSNTQRYDLASPYIYDMLESSIKMLSGLKGTRMVKGKNIEIFAVEFKNPDEIQPDKILDVRGELCPVPDIQTKNCLKELEPGEILLVIMDYPLSKERVCESVKREGNDIIAIFDDGLGDSRIFIRKNKLSI